MKPIKTKIAAAALLAMSGVGVANADSIASSTLNITNFKWIIDSGALTGQQLSTVASAQPHVTINPAGANNGNLLAVFEASSGFRSTTKPIVTTGGQIPYGERCAGPDCVNTGPDTIPDGQNRAPTGGFAGPAGAVVAPTESYAAASHSLTGAIVAIDFNKDGDLTDATDIVGGANAKATAESSLVSNATTVNGTANLGTSTAFQFVFSGVGEVNTHLELDYVLDVFASVVDPKGATDTAFASANWSFELEDVLSGDEIFSWKPNELQALHSVGAGESDDFTFDSDNGFSSQNIKLTGGKNYRVTVSHENFTFVTRNVPEPALLSLLGMGLLGFGLQKRKNGKMMA